MNRRAFVKASITAAGIAALRPPRLCAGQGLASGPSKGGRHTFGWRGEQFQLDDNPFQIVSGEMHYARIPRAYWRDRLGKLKSAGLNTVSTCVFWNFHEPRPGEFNFADRGSVGEFVQTAQEEGLWVIIRLGPYCCAEWDFGGLPAWLLAARDIRVRSADPRFLRAASRYMRHLGAELGPLQISRGGPIIMAQIENDYGSFGNDRSYMNAIKNMVRGAGFDVPLFTTDKADPRALLGGTLPDVLSFVNFGSDPATHFTQFSRFRRDVPRMCAEFRTGWFDHWGEESHRRNNQSVMQDIEWMLKQGVSFNLYMFHGGTSFGFMNGANFNTAFRPDVTSYDCHAPLDEAGRPRPQYFQLGKLVKRHLHEGHLPQLPVRLPVIEIPPFELALSARLDDLLGQPVNADEPVPMERLKQSYGFILYRWNVPRPTQGRLHITQMSDYALIYQGDNKLAELDRRFSQNTADVDLAPAQPLDILVENMGRLNYGPRLLNDRKGITGRVTLNDNPLRGWEIYPLPLSDFGRLKFSPNPKRGPRFYGGTFQLLSVGDTFLDMRGWGKGHVWVNGYHLGRFWKIGPQQTLYLPAAWLKQGDNDIIVFELETHGPQVIQGIKNPVLETLETN